DPMIRHQRESKTVGQGVNLDFLATAGSLDNAGRCRRIQRIEKGQGESWVAKGGGGTADRGGRHGLDGGKVAAGEVKVTGFVPVGGQIGGTARHAGQTAELAGRYLAFGFGQIAVELSGGQGGDFRQNGLDEQVAFGGLGVSRDAEESFAAGAGPGEGGDFEGEAACFAQSEVQAGGVAALDKGDAEAEKMRGVFQKRRDLFISLLKTVPSFKPFRPSGAFYLFVDIRDTGFSAFEVTKKLLDEVHVAVIPCESFGSPHHIRMSYATSEKDIEAAVQRIASLFNKK
ncbi:MAG: aminotransferase class I/II-fold pyridoxal phosphate-dependent enzyme, partial [Lentisphaerota bacterium]